MKRELEVFRGQKISLRDCLTLQEIYERAQLASEVGRIGIKEAIDTVLTDRRPLADDGMRD